MQSSTLFTASQNAVSTQQAPSLTLLEEGIQARLEQLTFSAYFPLEFIKESGKTFTAENIERVINHLEVTIIELNYLANELRWLQYIRTQWGIAS
mgnify:CR=1 FL=1